ncbi:hypothetical protein EW146_g5194 [Bondarzewia mesenterica]|uniref:Uncharacterized protein n=1 Tax=Bondarzewia mesenterica TaxID=1095465 RepID=A0A4S4LSA2_9AGAM|nr:hypothetical protein EW146_g5194 [Bondarzewia mesenterica]
MSTYNTSHVNRGDRARKQGLVVTGERPDNSVARPVVASKRSQSSHGHDHAGVGRAVAPPRDAVRQMMVYMAAGPVVRPNRDLPFEQPAAPRMQAKTSIRNRALDTMKSSETARGAPRKVLEDMLPSVRKRQHEDVGGRVASRRSSTFMTPAKRISKRGFFGRAHDEDSSMSRGIPPRNLGFQMYEDDLPDIDDPSAPIQRTLLFRDGRVYGKGARKVDYQAARKQSRVANVIEIDDMSPPLAELEVPSRPNSPTEKLRNDLETLTLSESLMKATDKLPFLRRNVRRGFRRFCSTNGVSTGPPAPPRKPVVIIYRTAHDGDGASGHEGDEDDYEAEMDDWCCPICETFGRFSNQEMLKKHLELFHEETRVQWEVREGTAIITLNVPKLSDEELEETPSTSRSPSPVTPPTNTVDMILPSEMDRPPVFDDVSNSGTPVEMAERPSVTAPAAQPSLPAQHKFKFKFDPFSVYASSQSAPPSTLLPIRRQMSSSPPPSILLGPQPPLDPLGPTARAPFFPFSIEGGTKLHYSCRPGGARLYDLLGTLPMERYGLLAWTVTHKEEEIFELDDTRDEDKVMQALWSRWILLHRNSFVENYCKGVIAFVDEYWSLIQLAAGWKALRVHLLVLAQSRYLTGPELVKILQHYESLTGTGMKE